MIQITNLSDTRRLLVDYSSFPRKKPLYNFQNFIFICTNRTIWTIDMQTCSTDWITWNIRRGWAILHTTLPKNNPWSNLRKYPSARLSLF